jgi:choline dehydrogenase-like flavoprotein
VVIVAANAIGSAALLLRSGLGSPVGTNLTLHPVGGVWGYFDEEVRPWTGTIQALYSEQLADLDEGYGLRFETAPVHPGLLALAAPWDNAKSLDRLMRQLSHTSVIGILLRDRFGGRITVDRQGVPVISYRLSPYDQRHMRRGIEGAARVLLAAGARAVFTTQNRLVELRPGSGDTVEDWLGHVDRVGYGPNQMGYVSFHQMGTCTMGGDRRISVVDGTGGVHGIRNLFVADGSLLPSASGVNPMVTIAALAHYVAQQIKARL